MAQFFEAPFQGEYPTLAEVHQALGMIGVDKSQYGQEVVVPMNNSRGPLDENIAKCKSSHLTTQWPAVFSGLVKHLLNPE